MKYDEKGHCIDELRYSDPFESALKYPDILFRRYKEVKQLQKIKKLSEMDGREISIFPTDSNEEVEYVLNNLSKYETKIQFWMNVNNIINYYPRLFKKIKNFFNNI